jgi:thioredoxin 1
VTQHLLEEGRDHHHIWWDKNSRQDFRMTTVKVDKSNFQADVLNANVPVVVDFWAEWCGPCKMIAPALEDIATELGAKVKIAKLNIDENPELAAQFGVRSIPTLMIFKGGEMADMKVGAAPKTALSHWINGNL